MAKHYKDTPWWWYVAVLVVSFVLGLVVVIKENITLPVWAYIVSLLLGIVIAPMVSVLTCNTRLWNELSDTTVEHHALFALRQWHCYQQPVKNAGRSDAP
jgi:uncharacterized membrane protein HdeD (DUF308 family)